MAFPSGTAYHADSDADDEYERSVMTSPTALHTDSDASPTDSEPPSTENTPTTYGNGGDDHNLPRTIITEWTAEECAQFVAGLGLRQYCDAIIGMLLPKSGTRATRLISESMQRTKL
jgi:protein STE50